MSLKTQKKRAPQENILQFFLLDTIITTCWMENLTKDGHNLGLFPQKIRALFSISKKDMRALLHPPPMLGTWTVVKYASISLNISKYPWKSLNKLFWLCQGSEYAWSSYMFDRLFKMRRVLNVLRFWLWHVYICNSYV